MIHKEVMAKLFDFNATTYYAWKKQSRPIIFLLESYFSKEELEEFLEHGSIARYDLIKDLSLEQLKEQLRSSNNAKTMQEIEKHLTAIEDLKKRLI